MTNETVSRRGLFALFGGAGVAAAGAPLAALAAPEKNGKPPVRIVDATVLWWNGRMGHARADDGARYSVGRAYLHGRDKLEPGDRLRLRVHSYAARSVMRADVLS